MRRIFPSFFRTQRLTLTPTLTLKLSLGLTFGLILGLASGFALPACAQSLSLPAGPSEFVIEQNGKVLGHTESNIAPESDGYAIESHGEMSLGRFHYSFTNHNRLDSELNIIRDTLTGTVNGQQATFEAVSSTDGRSLIVHTDGAGKTESNLIARHRYTVLLPDFDAASYVEMVHFAVAQPTDAWILIPKQNGVLVPANYVPDSPLRGLLHGASITVKHTTVVVNAQNSVSVELYYAADGTLLEADLPQQNFYVIRSGFELLNRPKPATSANPNSR